MEPKKIVIICGHPDTDTLTGGILDHYQVVAEDEDDNKEYSSIQSWRTSLNKSVEESDLRICGNQVSQFTDHR